MEWLAGGRVPDWVTPYSAQATAALKAQFPTQWPTIRDYGFAHPEIVGYMNAYAPEDAKIAYSLVEGIGTRWLLGGPNMHINLGITPDATTILEAHMSPKEDGTYSSLGCRVSYNDRAFTIHAVSPNSSSRECQFNFSNYGSFLTGKTVPITTPSYFKLDAGAKKGTINDTSWDISASSFTGNNLPIWLFANNNNGAEHNPGKAGYVDAAITKAGVRHWFIPFKRNNVMYMLDLATGNLGTNVGTFTELIESPS